MAVFVCMYNKNLDNKKNFVLQHVYHLRSKNDEYKRYLVLFR